jgi:hypothetical protein
MARITYVIRLGSFWYQPDGGWGREPRLAKRFDAREAKKAAELLRANAFQVTVEPAPERKEPEQGTLDFDK